MKHTQDIITELRQEAEHPACVSRVVKLLTEAADRIEHLYASGIHTCHADCQRPMCVLRRERDAALKRVAELEHGLKHQCETCEMKSIFDGEHDFAVKMQARVKELEAERDALIDQRDYVADELKRSVANQKAEHASDRSMWALRYDQQEVELSALRAANAEMAAELEKCCENFEDLSRPMEAARVRSLLACHAAGEPAKQEACGGRCGDPDCNLSTEGELMREPADHLDTERRLARAIYWIGSQGPSRPCDVIKWLDDSVNWDDAAVDAAMDLGGMK